MQRRLLASFLLATLAVGPLNASILFWRPPKQTDVAAVHVAVQSIAPFEE